MGFANLVLHRRLVSRRILQAVLGAGCLIVAVWLARSELPPRWAFGLALVASLGGLALVLRWELVVGRDHGLTVLPPGWGSFRPRSQEGAGRLLSLLELGTNFRWRPGGLLLGRPLPEQRLFGLFRHLWIGPPDDRHMLTIAGSRAGKGSAALIPNLLLYPGSALVIDPKGELAQITASRRGHGSSRVRHGLGQDVFVFDPEDIVVGLARASWNPLAELELTDPHLFGAVTRIAYALVPPAPSSRGEDEFFLNQARDLLGAFILHVLTTEPPERHHLIHVRRLITQGDGELYGLVLDECRRRGTASPFADAFEATLHFMAENPAHGGKVAGIAQRLIATADVTRSGILSTLTEKTSFLDQYSMEKSLQRSDFRLADLKLRPTTIYVCIKATSLAGPLSRIMAVMVDLAVAAMEEVPGRPPYNVLFALDEFYCLGRSESIDRAMGLMAGFGITLWPVLQHVGQLKRHYPDTWDNFVRNCRAVQYFGDLAPDLLDELERRIGYRVTRLSDGRIEKHPLISATELSSALLLRESRRQLVLFQQQPAALIELIDYFRFFPQSWYEEDPRASDRRQYGAWASAVQGPRGR